jgi:L-lactate dehydrogenase complex protein LldF
VSARADPQVLPVLAPGTPAAPPFPAAAAVSLRDPQLRRNLAHATSRIRAKRSLVVGEMPDWEQLRLAGEAIRRRAVRHLDRHLDELEGAVTRAGGTVHWARDASEANAVITAIARAGDVSEVIKAKSLTTDEIGLNGALEQAGIAVIETDLAELIVQLDGDTPSHILVPAIHRNRAEIRELFRRELHAGEISDDPRALAEVARRHLRERFLRAQMGITGANFAVAETGTVCVVESEGNGRMCLTLPRVLVSVMGIEKVIAQWRDLEVMLQLLPRSSTAERMNPYTSLWTGVAAADGPREFHLVLLDNGRSAVLDDPEGRAALHCIRCSACLNVCPVYERTGGHAYGSVYPGPIGAILTPQLQGVKRAGSLPYASSLCGACYEVCPVRIDIPRLLVHLRERVVRTRAGEHGRGSAPDGEGSAMRALALAFGGRRRYEAAQRVARAAQRPLVRHGRIDRRIGPLGAWTQSRDLPPVATQTFREWWRSR